MNQESRNSGPEKADKITVAGVTFGADDVVSCMVNLDGREIHITKKEEERKVGFQS